MTLVDQLIAVLPFEPAFFAEYGIPCTYAGHPAIEGGHDGGNGGAFRAEHKIATDATVLAMLPGSRGGEVSRIAPVFEETLALLAARHPDIIAVVPTVPTVAEQVRAATATWPVRTIVIDDETRHRDAHAASTAAITKSGTATLHLALAGVPMVVCYKVHPLTAFIAYRLVTTEYASLVNILSGREVVPEFIQERCTPQVLAREAARLLDDPSAWSAQTSALAAVREMLAVEGRPPSEQAAEIVLDHLRKEETP
jgi:lipid-A-disaccharide synthase